MNSSYLGAALGIFVFGLAFFFLALAAGPSAQHYATFAYYVNLVEQPLLSLGEWAILFCAVLFFLWVWLAFVRAAWGGESPRVFFGRTRVGATFGPLFSGLVDFARASLPVAAVLFVLSLAEGEADMVNRTHLMDAVFVKWDAALTGGHPFALLAAVPLPSWIPSLTVFSFLYLSAFLVAGGLYLAYEGKALLKEFASAFCFSVLLMFPVWLALPALSPHDRFLDNIYRLPVSREIAQVVAAYHPPAEVAAFLGNVRASKGALGGVMPTSTFPSAHVAWAVLLGYYLFRARRLAGDIVFPFLLFSSFGTVLLAQHYLVDVPAGIVVAVGAILLARYVAGGIPSKAKNPVPPSCG